MNENNNNFSLIRNAEINRIGPQFIQPIFYETFKIHERMKELGGYEDENYIYNHSKIWNRKNYVPCFANKTVNLYTKQFCILGIENAYKVVVQENCDYILLDTIPIEQIQSTLDQLNLTTWKCYRFDTYEECVNYFLIMYRLCENYEIIRKKEMKVIPLGLQCSVPEGIRQAGMREYSYPFDWLFVPSNAMYTTIRTLLTEGIPQAIEYMTNGYSYYTYPFIEHERFYSTNEVTVYQMNKTTGIGVTHHLINDTFKETLRRRFERFLKDISTNVMFIYADTTSKQSNYHLDDVEYGHDATEDLLKIHGLLYPRNKNIQIVYFCWGSRVNTDSRIKYISIDPCENGWSHVSYKIRDYLLSSENIHFPYNTTLSQRHIVINKNTKPSDSYLEIGVEYGHTFQNTHFTDKTGVDPDPKCEHVIQLTADQFFETNERTFDVIFIDGMHQTEYILRDFNNSLRCLNTYGTIFIDDILPLNYYEQMKIPRKHFIENGILKYLEPWTGDVWKFVYYLFEFHKDDFVFGYYNHTNYRGVGMFKFKSKFSIDASSLEIINKYQFNEFQKYLDHFKQNISNLRIWYWWKEYSLNTTIVLNDRFLFIQIPKTMSTNILNNCERRDMDCYRHEGLGYLENFIEPTLPVYAVVRNPYTHIFSFFFFSLKLEEYKLDTTRSLKENFESFVIQRIDTDVHFNQVRYITSNKGIHVKIFKFEDNNFVTFLNETHGLNLDPNYKSNENVHPLYLENKSNIVDFFSENLIQLVTSHRKREFEMFGYSTDINLLLK
jgi:hypothetical protein